MKQLLLIVIKGKFQVKYWNVLNFSSMWSIQTKQGLKRWLESFDLCLDSSKNYKINHKCVNLALRAKQATMVYWVMKRSLLLKTSSSRRQLHKLKNLSKKKKWISEGFISERWYSVLQRKDTSNRKIKCNLWNAICNERFILKHLLCTCDLQASSSSIQYGKQNPLAFRRSKTFMCRICIEICFETWIHNAG